MTTKELKEQIKKEYDEFCEAHGGKPNVAYVKCLWHGDEEPEPETQTIVLDETWYLNIQEDGCMPFIADEDVLYYCSNIDSLLGIVEDNGYADFVVVELVDFDILG